MVLESRVHARKLVEWAKDKPEVVVFSADLTSSTEVDLFRDTYPDRFYSFGMTEQNMMSFPVEWLVRASRPLFTRLPSSLPACPRSN